jgi:lysine-N-methylase
LEERGPLHFNYAESFRCIGSACEDTCCHGWKVAVDRESFERLQSLPEGPLRTLVSANLERLPQTADGTNPVDFAVLRMAAEGNHCPLLTEDRLCRIQREHGAALLPNTCATYPRMVRTLDGATQTGLTLSCPEAARLVLSSRTLLARPHSDQPDASTNHAENCAASPAHFLTHSPAPSPTPSPTSSPTSFWRRAVRDSILRLVANRNYPLWQRLFLIGVLCRRLDAAKVDAVRPNAAKVNSAGPQADRAGEPGVNTRAILARFEATVDSGALHGTMDTLPANDRVQLDAVLRLAGLMLHRSNVGPRFVQCVHAFTAGIGNSPDATLGSLADHYGVAHRRWFAPFFEVNPHILENLLINSILSLGFPFAKDRDATRAPKSMARQFAVLAGQFALVRGLLIGVAGHHRDRFCVDHVVHTVQAASKHFEHHPEFANQVESLLAESRLDDAGGLTILLNEPAGGRTAERKHVETRKTPERPPEDLKPGLAAAPPAAAPPTAAPTN